MKYVLEQIPQIAHLRIGNELLQFTTVVQKQTTTTNLLKYTVFCNSTIIKRNHETNQFSPSLSDEDSFKNGKAFCISSKVISHSLTRLALGKR